MLGRLRMEVDNVIYWYNEFVQKSFSRRTSWGTGEFSTSGCEDMIRIMIRSVSGDSDTKLLDDGAPVTVCKTYALPVFFELLLMDY